MKSLEKIAFFLLPLSTLFSGLTIIPNRILIISLLLIVIFRNKLFLSTVLKNKWLLFTGILYLLFIFFSNSFLSKEAILFLTIPIYLILYGYSILNEFLLKKYFILAVFTYSVILLLTKSIEIFYFGYANYIAQEQWWNQILYKNLTEELNGHPTYIAMFITSSIVMLLNQSHQTKKYFSSFKYILILAITLLVLFLLVVKISYLAMILILIVYIIFLLAKNQIRPAIISILFLFITGITLYNIPGIKQRLITDLNSLQTSNAKSADQNRLKERTALWKASLIFIKDHPFYGTSFHGVSSKNTIFSNAKAIYPQLEYEKNCHNNFLEFGVRYGLLGAGLFLILNILFFKVGINAASFEIIGISILICSFSLTESFMFREQGISLVAILTAILGKQQYGKNI